MERREYRIGLRERRALGRNPDRALVRAERGIGAAHRVTVPSHQGRNTDGAPPVGMNNQRHEAATDAAARVIQQERSRRGRPSTSRGWPERLKPHRMRNYVRCGTDTSLQEGPDGKTQKGRNRLPGGMITPGSREPESSRDTARRRAASVCSPRLTRPRRSRKHLHAEVRETNLRAPSKHPSMLCRGAMPVPEFDGASEEARIDADVSRTSRARVRPLFCVAYLKGHLDDGCMAGPRLRTFRGRAPLDPLPTQQLFGRQQQRRWRAPVPARP